MRTAKAWRAFRAKQDGIRCGFVSDVDMRYLDVVAKSWVVVALFSTARSAPWAGAGDTCAASQLLLLRSRDLVGRLGRRPRGRLSTAPVAVRDRLRADSPRPGPNRPLGNNLAMGDAGAGASRSPPGRARHCTRPLLALTHMLAFPAFDRRTPQWAQNRTARRRCAAPAPSPPAHTRATLRVSPFFLALYGAALSQLARNQHAPRGLRFGRGRGRWRLLGPRP